MNNRDEIQEYLGRIEMYIPPTWTLKFGEWDKFKDLIEDQINQELTIDSLNDEIRDMRNEIDSVTTDLEDICIEEEMSEREVESLQKKLQEAIDSLNKLT